MRAFVARPMVLLTISAALASAQSPAQSRAGSAPTATGTVSGVVYDSLSQQPLIGAVVQLVDERADNFIRTGTTDSLGRYRLNDVPNGRYMLGFVHPMLDSLGLEPPVREVFVENGRTARADLATPSPLRMRRAICGRRTTTELRSDSGGVVIGVVRDARTRNPAAGAAVTAEWMELSVAPAGISRRVRRATTTTAESGWYALCDVPSPGVLSLVTGTGNDSTDRLVMRLSASGFLRRDLYVASVTVGSAGVRRGDGRLSGKVTSADDGRAVSGAVVSIMNGLSTRANDRGEFVLSDVPAGSRMLDVRAVGFSPDRRAVDVIDGVAPVQVILSTLKAVLDTVRVRSERLAVRHLSGFSERKRAGGMGRFLTADDIARRDLTVMSDLFRTIPGTRLQPGGEGQPQIMIRGTLDEWCEPAYYVDGRNMGELSLEALDGWLRPKDVAGIEVYPGAATPPQFSLGLAGTSCGSIVIWTK